MNRILMIYNVLSDARKAGVGGDGRVSEEIGTNSNNHSECQRIKYKSESRILLVGSGADEQSAGYGPHKTNYKQSRSRWFSWVDPKFFCPKLMVPRTGQVVTCIEEMSSWRTWAVWNQENGENLV
uniref:Putative rossmann-like alpha/beta/alpha sandwich fold protein n=1 Tax=Helianthus annuus TaxID=4232 RepID=A0A251S0U9_HELAN